MSDSSDGLSDSGPSLVEHQFCKCSDSCEALDLVLPGESPFCAAILSMECMILLWIVLLELLLTLDWRNRPACCGDPSFGILLKGELGRLDVVEDTSDKKSLIRL